MITVKFLLLLDVSFAGSIVAVFLAFGGCEAGPSLICHIFTFLHHRYKYFITKNYYNIKIKRNTHISFTLSDTLS
jgi:hypothetical protein